MKRKHKHHIIPRHMGGSDDPSNLIELTIEEHAEAHRKLWEKYGKIADKIAWKMLSARVSFIEEEERIQLAKEGFSRFLKDDRKVSRWKEKIRDANLGKKTSDETKEKMSKSQKQTFLEGRRSSFLNMPKSFFQDNWKKSRVAAAEGRRKSTKWKTSVTSESYKNKCRLSSPKAKKISVNGVIYHSIREASKMTGIRSHKLREICFSKSDDNIFLI